MITARRRGWVSELSGDDDRHRVARAGRAPASVAVSAARASHGQHTRSRTPLTVKVARAGFATISCADIFV